jgi:hypothetical protein
MEKKSASLGGFLGERTKFLLREVVGALLPECYEEAPASAEESTALLVQRSPHRLYLPEQDGRCLLYEPGSGEFCPFRGNIQ